MLRQTGFKDAVVRNGKRYTTLKKSGMTFLGLQLIRNLKDEMVLSAIYNSFLHLLNTCNHEQVILIYR